MEFDRARTFALASQRKDNDSTRLAIVSAAGGDLVEAKRLAREAAKANDSASEMYWHPDVAHVFLGDQFRDFQREFPVDVPYGATPTLAVFLFEGAWQLEAVDIATALEQMGVNTPATAEPLDTAGKNVNRAFVLRFDKASVWLASGTGRFSDGWKLEGNGSPLAAAGNG